MNFIGRDYELNRFKDFLAKPVAGMAVVCGRRRVGKSTLIEQACKSIPFYEFYGLGPRENIDNSHQLAHFGELLGTSFGLPPQHFRNWNEAFDVLAKLTKEGRVAILLDEISWMAGKDKDFAGKLKGAWDTKFKKNPDLTLIICGSVTSWIEDNILNDKSYVGRISLTINLEPMPLYDADKFWQGTSLISAHEKFKILCVTGGIPRYLEEIQPKETAEDNIKRICFSRDGFLFTEFDKIFKDIFEKKAGEYKKIVETLADGSLDMNELCNKLGTEPTGGFSKKLKALTAADFITRDYVYNIKGKKSGLSKFRLKDNYLRFYLKYIEPKKDLITNNLYQDISLENLSSWTSIMGLQFENLVLNNLAVIVKILKIPGESIISAAPYFQNSTQRQKACQIDLLIQTKYTIYLCEIKFRKQIDKGVINEVMEKITKLKYPSHLSLRPILIYQGELAESIIKSEFFTKIISFESLLERQDQ